MAPNFSRRATFGRNVIGLDVYVDATLVFHALDLHNRLIRWGLQHTVIVATARMIEVHGAAQRLGLEAGRSIHIRCLAVDQHGAQT